MPGLVPGIHALGATSKDVDGRDKPGHDEEKQLLPNALATEQHFALRRVPDKESC